MTRVFPWARPSRSALAVALPALMAGMLAGEAVASPAVLPTGGKVAAGAVTIGKSTGFSLTIDQISAKAIIDWNNFSIGRGDKVSFENGAGITLNRVTGGQISDIDGALLATGGVYVLNPNGVVVGKSGMVNVGGDFVASSLALSNKAFLAGGNLSFTAGGGGQVDNLGYIVSANGSVELIAPKVANAGDIEAAGGDVGLAAGDAVVLHERDAGDGRLSVLVGGAATSAANSGLIRSAEAELRANGGHIYALAVNPGSGIEATGIATKGGDVWLVADGGDVDVSGRISAHRAGGAGGFVETSGKTVAFDGLAVDAGEWLIDPVTLTLNAAAASTIGANLATTNVVLQTTATSANGPGVQSAGAGDIIVAAPISWSSGKSLTLDAYHSILFDADVTVAGAGQVILKTDDGGTGGDYAFSPGDRLTFTSQIAGQALTINGQPFTLIYTEAELAAVNADLAGDYALAAPLSLQGFVFTDAPIAHDVSNQFTGVFTGLGNELSGLVIDQTFADPQTLEGLTWQGSVGLFGVIGAGGVVRDLGVTGADVAGGGNMRVGALAGVVLGTVMNDASSGSVSVGDTLDPAVLDASEAGGLVGSVRQNGQVLNSFSFAAVTGGSAIVGGLVGVEAGSASLISGSYAGGDVTAGASTSLQTAIGGELAGEIAGQASNDRAIGLVSGGAGSWVGGFAGYVDGGAISDSYAAGPVLQSASGAGFQNLAGGFAGYVLGGSISNAYASGEIIDVGGRSAALATLAGGFAGDIDDGANVSDAYSLGKVTVAGAAATVGGFAGMVVGDAKVTGFYATGQMTVSAGAEAGGVVGQVGNASDRFGAGGTISNGYWDEGTTGEINALTVTGAGVAQRIGSVGGGFGNSPGNSAYAKASYGGFDFTSVWYLIPGETRPILRSEYSTTIVNAHQLQLMDLNLAAHYTLGSDIDASETANPAGVWNVANGFSPVAPTYAAPFTGSLDGQGHMISNLTIIDAAPSLQASSDTPTMGYVGLFGVVGAAGSVSNLDVANATVTGGDGMEAGIVAGRLDGTIDNVTTSGAVTVGDGFDGSRRQIDAIGGGLVGDADSGSSIDEAASSADISGGMASAGGLVGQLLGATVSDSSASGKIAVGASGSNTAIQAFAGGLVGIAQPSGATPSEISSSHATGAASGGAEAFVGGFVGATTDANISDSFATGNVSGGGGSQVGGFVGQLNADTNTSTVSNSYATGDVTQSAPTGSGINLAGGFAGWVLGGVTVTGSYASGSVTSQGGSQGAVYAGGFAGYLEGDVSNSYALGAVTVQGGSTNGQELPTSVGGFAGFADSGSATGIYATGAVSSDVGEVGGLFGYLIGVASNGYWDEGTTGQTVAIGLNSGTATNLVGVGGSTGLNPYAAATYANFDLAATWYMIEGETRPILRSEYSTTITNAHQLELMSLAPGADYTLGGNIDASETTRVDGVWNPANGFVPVGSAAAPFTGTLNGQEFTISNLSIVVAQGAEQSFEGLTTDGFAGLFGVVSGPAALIQNINLASVSVTGGEGVEVGALAGAFLQGTIQGAASSGTVTGGDALIDANGNRINAAIGGLVGVMGPQSASGAGASIIGSSSSASVTAGDAFVGGLVGSTLTGSSISGSSASGPVVAGSTTGTAGEIAEAGGLAGSMYGATLANDDASGDVAGGGGSAVGGFAGYVGASQVSASYATGSVGQNGTSFAFSNYAGGFAGYVDTGSTIATSFASGAVTTIGAASSPPTFAGGFAGYLNGSVSQAYATGAVISTGPADDVGGFAGEIDAGGAADQVYATGAVSGFGSAGGLAGQLIGALSDSYWDEGTTGQTAGFVNSGGAATAVVGMGGSTGVSPYQAAAYAGWDFAQTWSHPSSGEYPELFGVSHVLEVIGGTTTSVYGQYPVYTYQILGVQDADIQYTAPIAEAPAAVATSTSGWIDVGTYALDPSNLAAVGGSGTYRSMYLDGSLTVTPAALTVGLTGVVGKTYDGTTLATISQADLGLNGLVAGDIVSASVGAAAYATKDAGAGIEVTASGIALTGADAANYTATTTTASGAVGEIDPKPLSVGLTGIVGKIYDGTTNATLSASNYLLSGVIAGDSVSLNDPAAGAYASKNAGTGIGVTVTGLALTGANAGDYTVASGASGGVGTIDPKALTATLVGTVSKAYDGSTAATLAASNYLLSGVVGGDSVALNDPASGTYASSQAGSGIAVTVTGLALSGAAAGDYTVNGAATAPIGIITAAGPVSTVTPGQVEIQVIGVTQVDTLGLPLTPGAPEGATLAGAAGASSLGANPTAYTVFPVTQGASAAIAGEASPVTGAGNGDLWAGSDLDPDQTCPSGKEDECKKGSPAR